MNREEAIDIIRKNIPHLGIGAAEMTEALNELIPELRESEDERIRKKLYHTVMGTPNDSTWFDGTSKEAMLAWLEKQKEPTKEELYAEAGTTENEYIANTMKMVRAMREKQKEPKPNIEICPHSIKSKSYKEQKPAWSEEDEDMLNSCISSIEEAKENRYAYKETDGDTSYDHEIAWLKSLRPSWKPSEEQIQIIKMVLTDEAMDDNVHSVLESLYEQLKKL